MTHTPKSKRGAWLVGSILALALCATVASQWYRREETREALRLWGPATAQMIASPDKVELLRLQPSVGTGDLRAGTLELRIVATQDVTHAPGFTNARHALVLDRSFDFAASPSASGACLPNWTHALRFTRGSDHATVLFSFACPQVLLAGADRSAPLKPAIANGLKSLVEQP